MNIKNLNQLFKDILYISRLTNVSNKKLTIAFIVIFSNLTVFFDILIIVIFSGIFSNAVNENFIIKFFLDNLQILPVVVLFRFLSIYFEKTMIYNLHLKISENLRSVLLSEVYERGNFSISDASFYVTKLTDHVSYFYSSLATTTSSLLQLILYIIYLVYSDASTLAYFFIYALFLSYPTYLLLKKGRSYMHQSYEYNQNFVKDIQKVVDNLFLIKIIKTKKQEFENFRLNITNFSKSQFNNHKYGTINYLIPNFIILIVLSSLVSFGNVVQRLSLEFIGVSLRLVQTLGVINNNLNMLINSHVHLEKFYDIETNKNKLSSFHQSINTKLEHAIVLKNIKFKYFGSEYNQFENLNLEIPLNKHTIITGPNGSGKSTLLGIIAGVFVPEQGEIISSSTKYSYVGATPMILDSTLRENLKYGNKENIDDSKLIQLVEDFKLFKESNVDLNLMVNNKSLSSGQMQKISFIRALISNSDILFLDESTSNLDDESKNYISSILDSLSITIVNCTHNPEDFNFDTNIKINYDGKTSKVYLNY